MADVFNVVGASDSVPCPGHQQGAILNWIRYEVINRRRIKVIILRRQQDRERLLLGYHQHCDSTQSRGTHGVRESKLRASTVVVVAARMALVAWRGRVVVVMFGDPCGETGVRRLRFALSSRENRSDAIKVLHFAHPTPSAYQRGCDDISAKSCQDSSGQSIKPSKRPLKRCPWTFVGSSLQYHTQVLHRPHGSFDAH